MLNGILVLAGAVLASAYQRGDPIALYERVMFGNEVSSPVVLAPHLLPSFSIDKTIILHGFGADELAARFSKATIDGHRAQNDFKLQLILGADESARTAWIPVISATCFLKPPADTCRYLQTVEVIFTHEPHLTGALTDLHVRPFFAANHSEVITVQYRWHTIPESDYVSATSWVYSFAFVTTFALILLSGMISPSVAQGKMLMRAAAPTN